MDEPQTLFGIPVVVDPEMQDLSAYCKLRDYQHLRWQIRNILRDLSVYSPIIVDVDYTTHFETHEVVVTWQDGSARREDEPPPTDKVRMPKDLFDYLCDLGRG